MSSITVVLHPWMLVPAATTFTAIVLFFSGVSEGAEAKELVGISLVVWLALTLPSLLTAWLI